MQSDRADGGRSGDSSLLRRLNRAAALQAFLDAEALTPRELRDAVGVSRPTAEELLTDLLAEGWVEETTARRQAGAGRTPGRPARQFRFRASAGYTTGIDIGAHKTMTVVTDLRGNTLARHRVELDPESTADERLRIVTDAVQHIWRKTHLVPEDIIGIACGVTGALRVSDRVQDVRQGPVGSDLTVYSLPGFTEVDVPAVLAEGLGRPVTVANDVKLAALAEHWKGAAQQYRDVVYMFAGHRAGAGVLINGEVHQGRHGVAGEIGTLPMLGWAQAVDDLHRRGSELAAAQGIAPGSEGELVIASAALQDPESQRVLTAFTEVLARGAAVLALAVDPEVIILGGGMSRGGAIIAEPFRRELAKHTLVPIEVAISTMGADSVALGAARLALDAFITDLLTVPGA
ncbi:ROK family transcriptional regulator [Kribbella sandramycini]|uniref:Putative NBD/HSP70 family sugar kinase n=1 Tax=Kribbella sandramycini TaxID=60450 RepID=A0A7Y4KX21_9ACTN|nr:ROK family protein [Kribbella sandramycini]MBB6569916.1 putative NBD/HSP70 family sugar kinase [Kribbella sandramycini]NOL40260.1 ROK family transcriptional regulator [Kribbella sandramycini]